MAEVLEAAFQRIAGLRDSGFRSDKDVSLLLAVKLSDTEARLETALARISELEAEKADLARQLESHVVIVKSRAAESPAPTPLSGSARIALRPRVVRPTVEVDEGGAAPSSDIEPPLATPNRKRQEARAMDLESPNTRASKRAKLETEREMVLSTVTWPAPPPTPAAPSNVSNVSPLIPATPSSELFGDGDSDDIPLEEDQEDNAESDISEEDMLGPRVRTRPTPSLPVALATTPSPPSSTSTDNRLLTLNASEPFNNYLSSSATWSRDKQHRFLLLRTWDSTKPRVLYIMRNPAVATEAKDDMTVQRFVTRSKKLGFGSMAIANLFGLFGADLPRLKAHDDPIGEQNDEIVINTCKTWANTVVCCWGNDGQVLNRGKLLEKKLREAGVELTKFGDTGLRCPLNPMKMSMDLKLIPWK